jgi:hypothetical protein
MDENVYIHTLKLRTTMSEVTRLAILAMGAANLASIACSENDLDKAHHWLREASDYIDKCRIMIEDEQSRLSRQRTDGIGVEEVGRSWLRKLGGPDIKDK